MTVVKGRASANTNYALTGLLLCAGCGRRLSISWSDTSLKHIYYWVCPHTKNYSTGKCLDPEWVKDSMMREQIMSFFLRLRGMTDPDIASFAHQQQDTYLQQLTTLQKHITSAEKRLNTLITRQSDAPMAAQAIYARQIAETSQQWEQHKAELAKLQSTLESPETRDTRISATRTLLSEIESLWSKAPREINQLLHRAMGDFRFLVQQGKIINVRAEPKRILFPRK